MTFLTCAAPASAAQVRGPAAGPLRAAPAFSARLGGVRGCVRPLRTLAAAASFNDNDVQGEDRSALSRFATLENYQLRRLKMAFFKGKRNVSVQELSKDVDLHRCVVLSPKRRQAAPLWRRDALERTKSRLPDRCPLGCPPPRPRWTERASITPVRRDDILAFMRIYAQTDPEQLQREKDALEAEQLAFEEKKAAQQVAR